MNDEDVEEQKKSINNKLYLLISVFVCILLYFYLSGQIQFYYSLRENIYYNNNDDNTPFFTYTYNLIFKFIIDVKDYIVFILIMIGVIVFLRRKNIQLDESNYKNTIKDKIQ